jgi:hypothetical protein
MILSFYDKNFTLSESGEIISICRRKVKVQDYVWQSWHEKIPKGYKVIHIDGNKFNNSISNLELVLDDKPIQVIKSIYSTEKPKGRPRRSKSEYIKKPKTLKYCRHCENQLTGAIQKLYCNSKCKHNYQDQNKLYYKTPKICPQCQQTFMDTAWGNKVLCSNKCSASLKSERSSNKKCKI